VASVALAMKNGEALLESQDYHLPKTSLPKKWPKSLLNKGSYMEHLVEQGIVKLV